jgi:aminopeptidase N
MQGILNRFGNLGAAIDACEYWYGPYAWGRVGYVLTTAGALEIPTNVAYPAFMTNTSNLANQNLYTHELGHQWWGVMVSPRTHNDMWLKEGPAEYSTHLIREWLDGQTGLANAVKENQYDVLRNAHINDDGFQALSPMPDPHIYGTHTYYKGAAVMHNLRAYMGDSLFRQAMHTIQEEQAYHHLDAASFREALESISGLDLGPYFDAHILSPGFAAFLVHSMEAVQEDGQWNVDLVIRQGLRGTTGYHQQVPLTLTLIGADRQSTDHDIMASGEFTTVTIQADFQPAIAVMDRHTRLNMGRIDYENTVPPGGTVPLVLPYVDFRVYGATFTDTTLLRVEHVWAAPDQDEVGWGLDQISGTHYWIVDGIWPEGTAMDGRIFYQGAQETSLDHDLYAATEENAILAFRPTPQDPWEVYPDFTVMAGNLFDGNGHIRIHNLQRGQYAFANGNFVASVADVPTAEAGLLLHPVPTSDLLHVQLPQVQANGIIMEVYSAEGRLAIRSFTRAQEGPVRTLDVANLAPGAYLLRALHPGGEPLGNARFVVAR